MNSLQWLLAWGSSPVITGLSPISNYNKDMRHVSNSWFSNILKYHQASLIVLSQHADCLGIWTVFLILAFPNFKPQSCYFSAFYIICIYSSLQSYLLGSTSTAKLPLNRRKHWGVKGNRRQKQPTTHHKCPRAS